MPDIDVVDSTWIATRPAAVAAVVCEPANWRRWWPDLDLVVDEWRGDKGVRWTVRGTPAGYAGSMEIWLEATLGGVVAHYFLRLNGPDGPGGPGRAGIPAAARRRAVDRYRRTIKKVLWAIGDDLDPGRLARVCAPTEQ